MIDPLIYGLGFLEKEPRHFDCLDDSTGEWHKCSKEKICDENIPKDHYRADTNDDEYFDNWVEKFDMLCEPKWKVGLIGSMYFIGVIVGMTFVPLLSDLYGRRWPFLATLLVFIVGAIGLIIATSLYEAYFYEFLIGFTFAGRIVVGLNWTMEYQTTRWHQFTVAAFLQSMAVGVILFTLWYQFVDRGWFLL